MECNHAWQKPNFVISDDFRECTKCGLIQKIDLQSCDSYHGPSEKQKARISKIEQAIELNKKKHQEAHQAKLEIVQAFELLEDMKINDFTIVASPRQDAPIPYYECIIRQDSFWCGSGACLTVAEAINKACIKAKEENK